MVEAGQRRGRGGAEAGQPGGVDTRHTSHHNLQEKEGYVKSVEKEDSRLQNSNDCRVPGLDTS